MQREEKNVDPSFVESRLLLCARRFLSPNEMNVFQTWMHGGNKMQAKSFLPERAYTCICLFRCWKIPSLSFFFFFFLLQERKEHNVEREKGRERQRLRFFLFLQYQYATTLVVKGKRKPVDSSATLQTTGRYPCCLS